MRGKLTFAAAVLSVFFLSRVSAQTLVLNYQFNETGLTLTNSGSATSANLSSYDSAGLSASDMHSASGTGVGGAGAAFNNSAVTGMGNANTVQAGASTTSRSANLGVLQSFTLSGWYKAETTPGGNARLVELSGSNASNSIVLMYGSSTTLTLNVEGTTLTSSSNSTYSTVGSWVFFSVTYDGTLTSSNVKFYVGTESNAATLVSTGTLNQGNIIFGSSDGINSSVGIGVANQYNSSGASNRPVDGLMDAVTLYGSTSDATGVLSAAQVETLRLSAIPEPSTVLLSLLGVTVCVIAAIKRKNYCAI